MSLSREEVGQIWEDHFNKRKGGRMEDNIASRVLSKCMPNKDKHKVKKSEEVVDFMGFGKKMKKGGKAFLKKLGTRNSNTTKKKKKSKKRNDFSKSFEDYLGEKPKFDM